MHFNNQKNTYMKTTFYCWNVSRSRTANLQHRNSNVYFISCETRRLLFYIDKLHEVIHFITFRMWNNPVLFLKQIEPFIFVYIKTKPENQTTAIKISLEDVIQRFNINTHTKYRTASHTVITTNWWVSLFIHAESLIRVVSLSQEIHVEAIGEDWLSVYEKVCVAFDSVGTKLISREVLKCLVLVHSFRFCRTVTATTATIKKAKRRYSLFFVQ